MGFGMGLTEDVLSDWPFPSTGSKAISDWGGLGLRFAPGIRLVRLWNEFCLRGLCLAESCCSIYFVASSSICPPAAAWAFYTTPQIHIPCLKGNSLMHIISKVQGAKEVLIHTMHLHTTFQPAAKQQLIFCCTWLVWDRVTFMIESGTLQEYRKGLPSSNLPRIEAWLKQSHHLLDLLRQSARIVLWGCWELG